ncbi:class I SAM-dependent DNA methyltransferase [Saccharopolyspora sp. CA-218241]|uniref:class I SAM-dependent DNA methyltransferase n=1 Tax=Saccharopolyspora sp. CA-218241 TaxID=3240027 RepID=UPI003D96A115
MEYSRRHADVYEAVMRSRGKDWEGEARLVAELVRDRHPQARSLLDVACGSGVHLESFRALFDEVAGLELSEPMRVRARRRVPGTPVHVGDLRCFRLDRSFDAICCLCFAIAYTATPDELALALGCMARHLVPGGVLVVEPWWFPERFLDGHVAGHVAEDGARVISRVTHSAREGAATRMTVRYTVADAGGITDFTETELVTLFTQEEYEAAFERAGCAVEHLPGGPNGRGLFVGMRRPEPG